MRFGRKREEVYTPVIEDSQSLGDGEAGIAYVDHTETELMDGVDTDQVVYAASTRLNGVIAHADVRAEQITSYKIASEELLAYETDRYARIQRYIARQNEIREVYFELGHEIQRVEQEIETWNNEKGNFLRYGFTKKNLVESNRQDVNLVNDVENPDEASAIKLLNSNEHAYPRIHQQAETLDPTMTTWYELQAPDGVEPSRYQSAYLHFATGNVTPKSLGALNARINNELLPALSVKIADLTDRIRIRTIYLNNVKEERKRLAAQMLINETSVNELTSGNTDYLPRLVGADAIGAAQIMTSASFVPQLPERLHADERVM